MLEVLAPKRLKRPRQEEAREVLLSQHQEREVVVDQDLLQRGRDDRWTVTKFEDFANVQFFSCVNRASCISLRMFSLLLML